MKKGIRRTAFLLLSLWFLLGAAAAEPYTVPKNLAEVSGLPENPEAPAMKTRTDGGTVSISVDGELTALNVCWNRIVFPLTLQDGEAAFTIDKKMVRVGVRGKQNGLKWTLRNPEEESGAEDTLLCSVTPCGAEIQQGFAVLRKTGSGNEYQYYRAESVDVKKPGYYYWVPIDAEISTEVLKTDGEGRPVKIREIQKITCEQRTIESDDRKADRETVQTMKQEMREAAEKLNVEPDPDDWELDTEGFTEITLKAAANDAEYSGIRNSDYPFEGLLPGGAKARYNSQGDCCEKEFVLTGADYFDSETAPTRVTVTWNKGKNMYDKIIWYISSIAQEYGDTLVKGKYSQAGKLINTVVR